MIAASIRVWESAVVDAIDALTTCTAQDTDDPGTHNQMSIIEHDQGDARAVSCVTWLDAKTHYGRRVRIDALGRCVYSQTPYHHDGKDPNRIFTNVTVVYANIGLTNERKGPDERSHIPQHILRIIDMWNQNIINQTDGVSRDAGDHSCYICKRRERMIDDVFAPIFRCALCLQFSHWACVEMISHELDNSTVLDAADKVQVHPQFLESDDTVCYLCKTVQSEFWSD